MLNFEVPDLYVKAYQNQFSGRQKTLFNALESAEKECGKDVEVKTPKTRRKHNAPVVRRSEVRPFRGKESIFKIPDEPPPRMRFKNIVSAAQNAANRSPNRGKWTKYSLETVDDMSDRSNARAAFSFLQELRDRRQGSAEDRVCLDQFKPTFKKRETSRGSTNTRANFQSTKKRSSSEEETPKSSVRENVFSTNTSQARITLHHLDSEE
jgi:hypothetical protein